MMEVGGTHSLRNLTLSSVSQYILPLAGNDFTGASVFEFEDSTAIEWTGNKVDSGACADGDTDFTSGSDSLSQCS